MSIIPLICFPEISIVSEIEHSVCDASWYGFENHCYFLSDEKRTWVEARKVCKDHDADLATIQNLEDNDFIFSEFAMGKYTLII